MTLIASLLFATALFASVCVIMLTVREALPRIKQVVELEFGPEIKIERRIFFGEIKGRRSAELIAFPRLARKEIEIRLAA